MTQFSREQARNWLAVLWFVASALFFLIILGQTFLGKFGDKYQEAWAWALPVVLPTLSLMIGVFVAEARGTHVRNEPVRGFFFWLTFGLSMTYLLFVYLTVLCSPWAKVSLLELMKMSQVWLAPIQGLVSGTIGAFFLTSTPDSNAGG